MIARGDALISAIRRPRFLAIALSLAAHSAVAAAGYVYVSWKGAPVVAVIPVEVIALPAGPGNGAAASETFRSSSSLHAEQQSTATAETDPEPAIEDPVTSTRGGAASLTVTTNPQSLEPQTAEITPIDSPRPVENASTPDLESVTQLPPVEPAADKAVAAMAIDLPILQHLNSPSPQVDIAVRDSAWHVPRPGVIAKRDPPRPIALMHPKATAGAPLVVDLQETNQTLVQPTIWPPIPRPRPFELRMDTSGPQKILRELQSSRVPTLASRVETTSSRNPAPFKPGTALRTPPPKPASATANPQPKSSSPLPPADIRTARSSSATASLDPPARVPDSDAGTTTGHTLRPRPGNLPPIYPRVARERGWEGRVVLGVAVDASGAIARVEVDQTSGYRVLDQAALSAVRRWRFVGGDNSVTSRSAVVRVPITFKLSD